MAPLNGQHVRIVGCRHGLRALGGVNIVTSLATARWLDNDAADRDKVAYYIVQPADRRKRRRGARSAARRSARRIISRCGPAQRSPTTPPPTGCSRPARAWAFVFLAVIVFLVGVVITSQTLFAAVASSVREYAMLNALGAGLGALRARDPRAGVLGRHGRRASIGSALSIALHAAGAPARTCRSCSTRSPAASCAVLVMAIALISGLLARAA